MKRISKILVLGAVILMSLNPLFAQEEEKTDANLKIAVVKEVKGSIDIQRDGEPDWGTLKVNDTINMGDQVILGHDGKLTVEISGHSLQITGRTLFSLDDLSEDISIQLWRGQLRSKIKKMSSNESFEIRTPVAVCAVRGTDFEVIADEKTKLKTYEGSVSFKNIETGEEVIVEEGEESTIEAGKAPTAPTEIKEPQEEEETQETEKTGTETGTDSTTTAAMPDKEEKRESSGSSKKSPIKVDGTLGADVLEDPDNPGQQKVYYNLSLMPELSIWKIGVGLDIRLYFDEDGNLKEDDWNDWSDVLQKVWYVRYGQKNDPFYIYAGGIKSYTLGSGIIVRRYSNMLNYPEDRRLGFNVKVDMGRGGFETFMSDVSEYPIFGGRLFYRPFFFTGIPIFESLQLGVQGAADYNPDMNDSTEKDEMLFYGADTLIPVLDFSIATANIYGGWATYKAGDSYDIDEPGSGMTVGLQGNFIKFIKYGASYSKLENNFETGYFDRYYEVTRASSPYYLKGSKLPIKEGPKFLLGFNLFDKADFSVEYENYNIDNAGRYPYFHGELNIAPALLLNKYSLSIYYDKKGVDTFDDLTELSGAIMTTELGYNIAPNVAMIIVQKQSFDEEGESEKTISMRTRFSF